MRIVIMLTIVILQTASITTATLQTTKPHPAFSPTNSYVVVITTDCRADTVVAPETIIALFRRAFTTEIRSRFGLENNHSLIVFEPSKNNDDTIHITITIKGYDSTLSSCSLYIEYTIRDTIYTYSDISIVTIPVDTKGLKGTYAQKKTAACEQGVAHLIKQFFDTFLSKQ